MSVLQAIELAEEWVSSADIGKKLVTVRKGNREYKEGRLILVAPTIQWSKEVLCTKVTLTTLEGIDEQIVRSDGFTNKAELKSKLEEYYGKIDKDTVLTVVEWIIRE